MQRVGCDDALHAYMYIFTRKPKLIHVPEDSGFLPWAPKIHYSLRGPPGGVFRLHVGHGKPLVDLTLTLSRKPSYNVECKVQCTCTCIIGLIFRPRPPSSLKCPGPLEGLLYTYMYMYNLNIRTAFFSVHIVSW